MPSTVPSVALNDGSTIPQLGFGVFLVDDADAQSAVAEALRVGYRSIDTAAVYRNEAGVGRALAESDIPRDELFITTKLWNAQQGYDSTLAAAEKSLGRLGLDHVDLYLIHWPVPSADRYVDTWRAFIELKRRGLVRSLGVSNFNEAHLTRIVDETGETPVINQIERHPFLQQPHLNPIHQEYDIAIEAWSPLGRGNGVLEDTTIERIAAAHGKTAAQVVLRWHLDTGNVVIPKSVTPSRIAENFDLFDFALTADDLAAIAALDKGERVGPDPEVFTGL
ncbi:MAG: aldo/keto reductase [Actinobacteria bacterium]|nr:aldo/keto reductase [Actinomycetota bacterium]